MWNKLLRIISHLWPILVLLLFSSTLAYLNFQSHTWLTGWDNLHPELNLSLNIKRSFSASWQEYQSLGLLGGMAHAADLPRQLSLYLISTIYDQPSILRYFWTFLMLIIGPIGTYFLAQNTLFSRLGPHTKRFISFFAGLFYLLNLATVQTFYTPFETFTSFYGFLPWLLLGVINYLKTPTRKNYLFLTLILLVSSPAFYTQTLFLVLLVVLTPFLLHHVISQIILLYSHTSFTHKKKNETVAFTARSYPMLRQGQVSTDKCAVEINYKTVKLALQTKIFKAPVLVLLTIFITQAYWLLPVSYFTATSSSITVNALQNQLATGETFARNQEFGNLPNVALLKGFWFDYVDLLDNNQMGYLLQPWINHFQSPLTTGLGFAFFTLILLGIIYSFIKKVPFRLPLLIGLTVCLFFLINSNPPTGFLYTYLSERLPLLSQAFRSVFTKWSMAASLYLSLFFAFGCLFVYNLITRLSKRYAPIILAFSISFLLIFFNLPSFQGHLIYKNLRTNIPTDYFQLIKYLNEQDPTTRLATFPQHTPWGWQFYTWGYRGSGFLWYGIEQPVLSRTFDVWSPYSERYHEEIKIATYSKDVTQLENVLERYSVTWLLLDKSITVPDNPDQKSLFLPEIEELFSQSRRIQKQKSFGQLTLFRFNLASKPNTFFDSTPKSFNPSNLLSQIKTQTPTLPDTGSTLLNRRSPLKLDPKNCDNFNATAFDKKLAGNIITYTATNASSCDHFLYPQLFLSTPYNLKITHRNVTGSPFLLCVEPYSTKSCIVFQYLPLNRNWTTTDIPLPTLSSEYGYAIHLFNYSIGRTPTQNQLSSLTFEPGDSSPPPTSLLNYPVILSGISHPSYSYYLFTATSTPYSDLLVLNQAFDKNWKLFPDTTPPNTPTFLKYFTHFFTKPINENSHFNAYGWANAWTLQESKQSYLLIYTPQDLQYLGFSLLLTLPLLYFFHRKDS